METITVPKGALVVLCGISGSGKSTFASRHFKPTQIVSSDHCRAMLCDDPNNQWVSGQAFALMHWIIDKRLALRRTTVADSTALSRQARRAFLKIARSHHAHTVLLCFDVKQDEAEARDRQRERTVGPEVINKQYQQFVTAVEDAQNEGWDQIVVLHEADLGEVKFTPR